jgi:hypothetical protein
MANGTIPADYTTSVGQTRLLIPDTAVDGSLDYIFSDTQINALLGLFGDNVKRAAAAAKDILASDNVLLLKVVRTDDLNVDGAKVAAELRAQAKSLRDQADVDEGTFDYFDIVYPDAEALPEAVPFYGRFEIDRIW